MDKAIAISTIWISSTIGACLMNCPEIFIGAVIITLVIITLVIAPIERW